MLEYDSSNYAEWLAKEYGAHSVQFFGQDADFNLDFKTATDGDFSVNGSQFFIDSSTGSVGIGTSNPGPHPGEGSPGPVPLHVKDTNLGRIYLEGNGSIPAQVKWLHTGTGKWFSWDFDRRNNNPLYDGLYLWYWDGTSFTNMFAFKEDKSITLGERWFGLNKTKYIDMRVNSSDTALTVYQAGTGHLLNVTSGAKTGPSRLFIQNNGNVGIGTTSPGAKLEVNGGIKQNTTETKPSCAANTRGTTWFTQGVTGVKDSFEVCAKDEANNYSWKVLY